GELVRVSRSGKTRNLVTLGGPLMPQDVAPDGTVLLKVSNTRREIVGVGPDGKEHNLTWLDWSFPDDISDDGRTILFDGQSRGRANYYTYIRKTDGSQAVQLAKAKGFSLSPDGRWALTTNVAADEITLVPTGAGNPRALPKTGFHYDGGYFFRDGKRLLIIASEPGHAVRFWVQDLDGGKPRPITREDQHLVPGLGKPIGPKDQIAVNDAEGRLLVLSAEGGEPRVVPGIQAGENVLGWAPDGRSLYVGRTAV